jgi:hypothetical protein
MQNIDEDMLPDQTLTTTKVDSTVSITAAQVIPIAIGTVFTKTNSNPIELSQSNQNTAKTKVETKPIPKQTVSIEKQKQIVKTNQVKGSNVKVNKAKPKALMPSVH